MKHDYRANILFGSDEDYYQKYYANKGYNISEHAKHRIFERSSAKSVLDVLSNGEKFIDKEGNLTYYKNGLSVHTNKNTGKIITVIYRSPERKLPKSWRKYDEQ